MKCTLHIVCMLCDERMTTTFDDKTPGAEEDAQDQLAQRWAAEAGIVLPTRGGHDPRPNDPNGWKYRAAPRPRPVCVCGVCKTEIMRWQAGGPL